jgi:hypothetical protein
MTHQLDENYWSLFNETPEGERVAVDARVQFSRAEIEIRNDLEALRRQRARRAALYEEILMSYKAVFGGATFEQVKKLVCERDDNERRLSITAAWLEHSKTLEGLPIRDIRQAIRADVFALPAEVQSLVVAARQLLPEDRAPDVLIIYWDKSAGAFAAPEISATEMDIIQRRHTVFAKGIGAHWAGLTLQSIVYAINAANSRHPEHFFSLADVCQSMPFLAPHVAAGRGKEIRFEPGACLFELPEKTLLTDETLSVTVNPGIEDLFLNDLTNAATT